MNEDIIKKVDELHTQGKDLNDSLEKTAQWYTETPVLDQIESILAESRKDSKAKGYRVDWAEGRPKVIRE